MKILITGATGLVGSKLSQKLSELGHDLVLVSRKPDKAKATINIESATYVSWDEVYRENSEALAGLDSVVNLAGEPLVEGRWSEEKMRRIDESRSKATDRLIQSLKNNSVRLSSFISASAMGIYGSRGDEILDEASSSGEGFLAEVCKNWEKPVAEKAPEISERQVLLRISLVLSDQGGFLGELLPIFRKGIGGPIADGKAWMSWIHQADLVNLIIKCIEDTQLSGPINCSAPQAVTNSEMTKALGKAVGMPAVIPVPSFGLQLMFGKKAEMLLASIRLKPSVLDAVGFPFKYKDLDLALSDLIK